MQNIRKLAIKTVLKILLVISLADLSLSDMRTNYCMVSPLLFIIAWKYSVFLANLLYFILPNYVEDLFKSVPRFELICTVLPVYVLPDKMLNIQAI